MHPKKLSDPAVESGGGGFFDSDYLTFWGGLPFHGRKLQLCTLSLSLGSDKIVISAGATQMQKKVTVVLDMQNKQTMLAGRRACDNLFAGFRWPFRVCLGQDGMLGGFENGM